jgi:hypothetical protein
MTEGAIGWGFAFAAGLGACGGGGDGGSGSTTEPANACATRGATYIETLTELPGGTCGPAAPEIFHVSAGGTITSAETITCAMVNENGCTTQETDCTYTENGYSVTVTREMTFTTDGSSASGECTFMANGNGIVCTSTYDIAWTREGPDGG